MAMMFVELVRVMGTALAAWRLGLGFDDEKQLLRHYMYLFKTPPRPMSYGILCTWLRLAMM